MKFLFVSIHGFAIENCIFSLVNSLSDKCKCDILLYDFCGDINQNINKKGNIFVLTKEKKTIINKVINKFLGRFLVGFISTKKEKKIREKINELNALYDYDYLITCSGEYGIHCIKSTIKKHFMYLVDPFYFNFSFSSKSRFFRLKVEKKCMNKCIGIFCPLIMKKEYFSNKKFKVFNNKIINLEFPLIYERLINTNEGISNFDENNSFFYFGTFYDGIRNPQYLIDFFKNTKYELYIAGTISRKYRNIISNIRNIHYIGQISNDLVNNYIYKAKFLINVGNSVPNQTPSKIFEYISFGKPIINFYKINNCSSKLMLENYAYPYINIFEDYSIMDKQVSAFTDFVKSNLNYKYQNIQLNNDYFIEYTPKYVAKKFEESIASLVTNDEKIN